MKVLKNISLAFLMTLIVAGASETLGQALFLGLKAGTSTKLEVERVLGKPVKQISPTLIEYAPQSQTGRIFVQYRTGSPVVERFEFLCRSETSTCTALLKNLKVSFSGLLPQRAVSSADASGKIVRYYYAPDFVSTTIDNESDGLFFSLEPARVALYSRELFAVAVGAAQSERPQLVVTALRFFESGVDPPPMEERQYNRRFPREGTRYINFDVTVEYPKFMLRSPYSITSLWSREGVMPQPLKTLELNNKLDDYFPFRSFNQGLGDPAGHAFAQRTGKWTVELVSDGRTIAVGSFEIY